MRRLAAVAALAAVALAACGGSSSSPGGTGPPRPPAGSDEVVVRVVTEGGFAAESRQPAQLPRLSVYGDGRVITLGPTTLEFPGPALPNLQEFRVTGAGTRHASSTKLAMPGSSTIPHPFTATRASPTSRRRR